MLDLLTGVQKCEEHEASNGHNRHTDYARAYPPNAAHQNQNGQDACNNRVNGNGRPQYPQGKGQGVPENGRANVPLKAAQVEPEYEYECDQPDEYYQDEGYEPVYDENANKEDQELELYTCFFAASVQLADDTERRNGKRFNCKEGGHQWRACPKPLHEEMKQYKERLVQHEHQLNRNGGLGAKGGQVTPAPPAAQCSSGRGQDTSLKNLPNPPYFWNDDPCGCWYGPENIGYALIDGHRELVLIDSGARANSITLEYATKHKLVVAPVHELADNPRLLAIVGVGGVTNALGYVIINIKIEEIPSYAEDQVALVVTDISGLGQEVPVILGTPTIHQLCKRMKESECKDLLESELVVARWITVLSLHFVGMSRFQFNYRRLTVYQ